MKSKFTHTAIMSGCDRRTTDKKVKIKLRETKTLWVSITNNKFKKLSGYGLGNYPMYRIDLSTLEKIRGEG